MRPPCISIRGARQHNLQAVDLDIPKRKLSVFTGVSGSGKSSLAFDTLFAEGQRRYVESLSSYARQFLGQMDKPAYDAIRGLTPTIAVAQQALGRNPRSTVGTLTEISDYLRVLYARAGLQRCHRCGRQVGRQSAAEIAAQLSAFEPGTRYQLLAPVLRGKKGAQRSLLKQLRQAGHTRVRLNGEQLRLEELDQLEPGRRHDLDVVADRLKARPGLLERITDSVETALQLGQGILICKLEGAAERIFSEQLACHDCGCSFPELTPQAFSFNSPQGMCPSCKGLGTVHAMDLALVVPDEGLSLHQGAILPWAKQLAKGDSWNHRMVSALAQTYGFDLDTPWRQLSPQARQLLLHGTGDERFGVQWSGRRGEGRFDMAWEGVLPTMLRRMKQTKSEAARKHYMSFMSARFCDSCQGARLRPESLAVRVGSHGIAQLSRASIVEAKRAIEGLELEGARAVAAREICREIADRLGFLADVGLGYLCLERSAATLSGGEAQRIRLASQLGGELTGVTYVLDEPTIGLHQRDNQRLVVTLRRLRDLGNTVVVVEHDRETIEAADWVFDFGPGAGSRGGRLVASAPPDKLGAVAESVTGAYLSGARSIPLPARRRPPAAQRLVVLGARENNLNDLRVEIPLGCLVAITGVSGAGKSSLVNGILSPALRNALHGARRKLGACSGIEGIEHLGKLIHIDQAPIGRTPRSNPATYTKLLDPIRRVFASTKEARLRGYGAGRFSFNNKGGRCEACKGDGFRRIELHFLPDVFVPCELCKGRRFNDATLSVRFKGCDIHQVLSMSASEALSLFAHHKTIRRILRTLEDVGLGYLQLGQPSNTLSGGEAQRIKLSRELARAATGDTLYLLDEPTTGLHFDDIRKLLAVLQRLADAGNTVLVVEHNLDVIKCADHVIDLGPGGGSEGGRMVACGTPEQVAQVAGSHTGRFLKPLLTAGV